MKLNISVDMTTAVAHSAPKERSESLGGGGGRGEISSHSLKPYNFIMYMCMCMMYSMLWCFSIDLFKIFNLLIFLLKVEVIFELDKSLVLVRYWQPQS